MTAVTRKRKLQRWRDSNLIGITHDVLVVDATVPMTPAEIAEVKAAFRVLASGELQRTHDDKVAEFAARGVDERERQREKAQASAEARRDKADTRKEAALALYRTLMESGNYADRDTAGIIARRLKIGIRTVQVWRRDGNWAATEKAN